MNRKAVAFLSGGLHSTMAVKMMLAIRGSEEPMCGKHNRDYDSI